MNNFEKHVVEDISSIKTETKNCQRACLERHGNLDREIKHMKSEHSNLEEKLFHPETGVITNLRLETAKQLVINGLASFIGSTVGILVLGYIFARAVGGH